MKLHWEIEESDIEKVKKFMKKIKIILLLRKE